MIIPYTPNPDLHPTECLFCCGTLLPHGKVNPKGVPSDFTLVKLTCAQKSDHIYEFQPRYDRHFLYFKKEKCVATITRTRTSIRSVAEDPYYNLWGGSSLERLDVSGKEIFFAEKTFNLEQILETIKNLNILN